MGKVLITTRSVAECDEALDILKNEGHDLFFHIGKGDMKEDEFCEHIAGMDALIVGVDQVNRNIIDAGLPDLKIIARNGVGYNNVDIEYARQHGIPVTIAYNSSKISVCELALGMMFQAARNIAQQNSFIKDHQWKRLMGFELYGKTLGIIGCGNIGTEVAKRAAALGMKVLLYDIVQHESARRIDGATYVELDELLKESDIISLHMSVTARSKGFIDKQLLMKMKQGTILINTARGLLVNEEDVLEALNSDILACYATDTLIHEPASENDPLVNHPKTIITPHCGAYTREAVRRCGIMVAEEVNRVLRGEGAMHDVFDIVKEV